MTTLCPKRQQPGRPEETAEFDLKRSFLVKSAIKGGSPAEPMGALGPISSRASGSVVRRRSGWLASPHRSAHLIVPRPRGSRSSPAPSAHRCAAAGLDREPRGRAVCMGAVNGSLGSSLVERFARGCGCSRRRPGSAKTFGMSHRRRAARPRARRGRAAGHPRRR